MPLAFLYVLLFAVGIFLMALVQTGAITVAFDTRSSGGLAGLTKASRGYSL